MHTAGIINPSFLFLKRNVLYGGALEKRLLSSPFSRTPHIFKEQL
jgi:hypothetical protein